MLGERTVLAVIAARGGSKGVPRKNVRSIAGKPLIAWTIEEAKKSKYIDRLVLSSEDEEIMQVAQEWGCEVPFRRPLELAQDTTPVMDSIFHCIGILKEKYDYVVLLTCTSPLRIAQDIDGAIEVCAQKDSPCVSLSEPRVHPYWMFTVEGSESIKAFTDIKAMDRRRQTLPRVVGINGAVYVSGVDYLLRMRSFLTDDTVPFIMPIDRSIEIDSELDFRVCECLLEQRLNNEV